MVDRDNPAVIVRYLLDLDEIRTEHLKAADLCPDGCKTAETGETGICTYMSVITVEILTYQRKLAEMARI
jgi:hypothetical protein